MDLNNDYEYGFTATEKRTGSDSAFIKAKSEKPTGYRTWAQGIKADSYRGKRVRLSGYVKTDHVMNWGGLWMEVSAANGKELGFDNMHDGKNDRSLHGTADWQACSIVLDVPKSAGVIIFGGVLSGSGTIWLDDLSIETVNPKTVAVTAEPPKENKEMMTAVASLPKAPRNLDFEQ